MHPPEQQAQDPAICHECRPAAGGGGISRTRSRSYREEILLSTTPSELAGENPEKVIWESPGNRFFGCVSRATLTLCLPDNRPSNGPLVLILPGGGYWGVCIDKEGFAVADALNAMGIAAAVLKYRFPRAAEAGLPMPFVDGLKALEVLAERRAELGIGEIGLMGFSAGGHLAGSLALRFSEWSHRFPGAKPTFLALIYPVVSAEPEFGQTGIFQTLLGGDLSPDMIREYSLENHVRGDSPRLFLVHALDDEIVPPNNSLLLKQAADSAGVPADHHTYPGGGHGFGLGGGPSASWLSEFLRWLG